MVKTAEETRALMAAVVSAEVEKYTKLCNDAVVDAILGSIAKRIEEAAYERNDTVIYGVDSPDALSSILEPVEQPLYKALRRRLETAGYRIYSARVQAWTDSSTRLSFTISWARTDLGESA